MSKFESKFLYEQFSAAEDGSSVLSSVYAVYWTYPGAMTKTSSRIRTTFIYQVQPGGVLILGGTIEKWRSEGWGLIEEYLESRYDFLSLADCKKRLLGIAESLLTGVPLQEIDSDYFPDEQSPPDPAPTKPDFKVIDYQKSKNQKADKKTNKDKSKKEPDFDWV